MSHTNRTAAPRAAKIARPAGLLSPAELERYVDLLQGLFDTLTKRVELLEFEKERHVGIQEHLERRIVALEDVRRPSIEAIRVFLLLPARAGGSLFTLKELFERITLLKDVELLDAFVAADADTPRKAGKMFRQLEGRLIEGYRLRRVKADRDGILWSIERF